MKKKKNNKICKAKKRPEPEGSWPLKIHNRTFIKCSLCEKTFKIICKTFETFSCK